MEKVSKYKTVKDRCEGLYKEKGSKFIGIAVSCYNEAEAKDFLSSWRKEHHQSRHLCYAYRFGVNKDKFRANDDGEPSNSAGAPILGVIKSNDLTNVLIGVVRYYGGTKLGVGGLINAYRTAGQEAINAGDIIELEVFDWYDLTFEYVDMSSVMNLLKQYDLEMHNKRFEENCNLKVALPLTTSEAIREDLEKLETVELISKGIY